jgi:hypothetical protein
VSSLDARQAYLDGEFCGVYPGGITSFGMIQAALDAGNAAGPVYFISTSCISTVTTSAAALVERKARLAALLSNVAPPLHYSDYHRGQGAAFHQKACELSLEGIVSKRGRCPLYTRQSRALHVIQHTDRNLSSSHTRGTRFTANAFASTAASDVPAVRSFTSRCSQVFREKFQHGCAMLRCAQRYRRGRPGLQSRP